MNEEDKLIKWLEIQSELARGHGYAIWEEMKHFSWALYVVLAAAFFLKFQFQVQDISLLIIWPILAIILSFIAMYSIYKEGSDYIDVVRIVIKLEKKLKLHETVDIKREEIINRPKYKTLRYWFIIYFLVLILIGIFEIFWLKPQFFSKEYLIVFISGIFIGLLINLIICSFLDKGQNKKTDNTDEIINL